MGNSISSAGYNPSSLSQCFNPNFQFDIELHSSCQRNSITPFSSVAKKIEDFFSIADKELDSEKKKRNYSSASNHHLFRDDDGILKKVQPLDSF